MGRDQSVVAPNLRIQDMRVKKKLSPEEGKMEREMSDGENKEESTIVPRVVLRKELIHV